MHEATKKMKPNSDLLVRMDLHGLRPVDLVERTSGGLNKHLRGPSSKGSDSEMYTPDLFEDPVGTGTRTTKSDSSPL
jgi:hypothetical protein